MPRKEFEAFTRLDASDVNTYLMDQSVMTFAGTAARGSAIVTPVAGMITYLEDSNTYETYSGSSYSPLVASGLELVKSQTIGTAVSSVVVSDVFSANYDNYKIVGQILSATTNLAMSITLGATATGYYSARNLTTFGSVNTVIGATNTTALSLGAIGTQGASLTSDIIGPFLTTRTGVVAGNTYHNASTSGYLTSSGGFLDNALSYTSFTLNFGAGNVTGGTIYVYGYKKA